MTNHVDAFDLGWLTGSSDEGQEPFNVQISDCATIRLGHLNVFMSPTRLHELWTAIGSALGKTDRLCEAEERRLEADSEYEAEERPRESEWLARQAEERGSDRCPERE